MIRYNLCIQASQKNIVEHAILNLSTDTESRYNCTLEVVMGVTNSIFMNFEQKKKWRKDRAAKAQ